MLYKPSGILKPGGFFVQQCISEGFALSETLAIATFFKKAPVAAAFRDGRFPIRP